MANHDILGWAARRAAGDSIFLAHPLGEYMEMNGLSERDLARHYGCSQRALTRLFLCLTPDLSSAAFRSTVERIAAHYGANPQRLAESLREVDAVRTMRTLKNLGTPVGQNSTGFLLAARDRARSHRKRGTRKGRPRR
jgi:hypothetical protein